MFFSVSEIDYCKAKEKLFQSTSRTDDNTKVHINDMTNYSSHHEFMI